MLSKMSRFSTPKNSDWLPSPLSQRTEKLEAERGKTRLVGADAEQYDGDGKRLVRISVHRCRRHYPGYSYRDFQRLALITVADNEQNPVEVCSNSAYVYEKRANVFFTFSKPSRVITYGVRGFFENVPPKFLRWIAWYFRSTDIKIYGTINRKRLSD